MTNQPSREIQPKHGITLWLTAPYETPDNLQYFVIAANAEMLSGVGANIFGQAARFPDPALDYRPILFNEEARIALQFIGLELMGAYVLEFLGAVEDSPDSNFHLIATVDPTDAGKWTYTLQVPLIIGEKGDKGDKGDAGNDGAAGATGATGATGAKGDKGDKGDTGAAGAAGSTGAAGAAGATGAAGAAGTNGTNGTNGLPAVSITDTPTPTIGTHNRDRTRCGAAWYLANLLASLFENGRSNAANVNSGALTVSGGVVGLLAGIGLITGGIGDVAAVGLVAGSAFLNAALGYYVAGQLSTLTSGQLDILRQAFYCNLAVDTSGNLILGSAYLSNVKAYLTSHVSSFTSAQVTILNSAIDQLSLTNWSHAAYIGSLSERTDCNGDGCDQVACGTTIDFRVNQHGFYNYNPAGSTWVNSALASSIPGTYISGSGFGSQNNGSQTHLIIATVQDLASFTLQSGIQVWYARNAADTNFQITFLYKDATGWHAPFANFNEFLVTTGHYSGTTGFGGAGKSGVIAVAVGLFGSTVMTHNPAVTIEKLLLPC